MLLLFSSLAVVGPLDKVAGSEAGLLLLMVFSPGLLMLIVFSHDAPSSTISGEGGRSITSTDSEKNNNNNNHAFK